MKFTSLHGHSSFSYYDGHGSPEEHVLRAKELGMDAIALTEHGNVSSHVQLEKAAKKHGLKPIYGCELYVAPEGEKRKFHQTVLAMNENGYRQLSQLVTHSWDEGFYDGPTVLTDWLLDPELTSDLVVLSGCADSWLSCTLAGGKSQGLRRHEQIGPDPHGDEERLQMAATLAEKFREVYGDRYYLELQRFKDYPRTVYLNQQIEQISKETGIPLVATADVHYPHREDWEIQRLANSIGWAKPVEELAKGRDYEASNCSYPLSDKEMAQDLVASGVSKRGAVEAIRTTREIARRCTVELPKTEDIRYSESSSLKESKELLLKAIKDGITYRKGQSEFFANHFQENKSGYKERISKELKTILPKHFADYFLINQQIIGWAKDQGIAVGPGRGSAAGSLVCYLLRLTEINPMEYPDMLFERFLDPSREDAPDIDTDYQDTRRVEVFEYARKVYGQANVGNIGNFNRFRGKRAINSAAKSFGIPPWTAENYGGYIAEAPYGDPREFDTAEDAAGAFAEVREIIEEHPELKLAWRLEGDMAGLGVHAAGMVLSNRPISEVCAVYHLKKANDDEADVIAFDKRDAAHLNFLKLDCLGLKTMTIVADVIDMVPDLTLEQLYALRFEDERVLQAFADDDLVGIFQFEGRATRNIVKDIYSGTDKRPHFMTLADMNALSRPGSLSSGMTAQYVKVERGAERKAIHPVVDEILSKTNGCLVYQEQVMQIGKQFGGMDDSEIGRLRKIIGAKQAGGAFEAFWEKFKTGASEIHGASEEKAREVWDYMAASATYLFNIAHAISYAAVAYWCMWLKVYYPAEFFAASLRSAATKGRDTKKVDPQLTIMKDVVKHGLTVSPPQPSTSQISWEPNYERTGVLAGFSQIPRVGLKLARRMVETRDEVSVFEPVTWSTFVEKTPNFGLKAAETAAGMSNRPDPFGIHLTGSVIETVRSEIAKDPSLLLDAPTARGHDLPAMDGDEVVYVGHVVTVKTIDVIGELRKRENLTAEEAVASLKEPSKATKAKVVCVEPDGSEVHVNVSRFNYEKIKPELDEIGSGVYAIHVKGKANNAFGPSIQASKLTTIKLEEK